MTYPLFSDEYFMNEALKEAENAFDAGEIPVGAVIVVDNKVIARGHNMTEGLIDVTAHAEMIAITAASIYMGSKFLNDCILYVSLEPCLMCAGAIRLTRLKKLVYGASEPKTGFRNFTDQALHSKTEIVSKVLKEESESLLKKFFQSKR